jgi:hypothetical protein
MFIITFFGTYVIFENCHLFLDRQFIGSYTNSHGLLASPSSYPPIDYQVSIIIKEYSHGLGVIFVKGKKN